MPLLGLCREAFYAYYSLLPSGGSRLVEVVVTICSAFISFCKKWGGQVNPARPSETCFAEITLLRFRSIDAEIP